MTLISSPLHAPLTLLVLASLDSFVSLFNAADADAGVRSLEIGGGNEEDE